MAYAKSNNFGKTVVAVTAVSKLRNEIFVYLSVTVTLRPQKDGKNKIFHNSNYKLIFLKYELVSLRLPKP